MDPFTMSLIMMAASSLLTLAFSSSSSSALTPATLEDFDYEQVDEGTPQPVVFGENWVDDFFIMAYGNLRTKKVKAKEAKK